jgi:hypothetical protein
VKIESRQLREDSDAYALRIHKFVPSVGTTDCLSGKKLIKLPGDVS